MLSQTLLHHTLHQARSQEFVMEGRSPQLPEARGCGGGAPSARQFLQFLNKNNAFLGIFRLKFLLKHALIIAKKDRSE